MDRDKLNNDLSYAVRTKHDISEIRQLIEDGADVNFRARDSSAPLHYAAEFGYDKAAKVLLDAGPFLWRGFYFLHSALTINHKFCLCYQTRI